MSAGLVMQDNRRKAGRGGERWSPTWGWPKFTEKFVGGLIEQEAGPSLHVCSGASRLGDLKVDRFHPNADIKADGRHLPFPDASMGVVVCDPPFKMKGNHLVEAQALFNELLRVVKDGGAVLLHAPWLPQSSYADLEASWVRGPAGTPGFPFAPVLLTRWRRKARPVGNLEEPHA